MKILIITPRIPYPPYRGDKLKIFNISKILSRNNEVFIITFYQNRKDLSEIKEIEKLGIKVIPVKLSILESLVSSFFAIFSATPFQVAWYKSRKMRNKIAEIVVDYKFDVIYYHLIRSAQFLTPLNMNSGINVIDFTDAVSLYLSRLLNQEKSFLKKLFIKSELNRINHYEKIVEKFDVGFICSEADKEFLLGKGINQNIKILKNGIDVHYFSSQQKEYDPHRIIFTGNMPYYPNSDAALFFAKEIFPLVLAKQPKATFFIVGQKPSYRIKNLESQNIKVTGFVRDIKSEYLKSSVNVAPMRFGAGTLNKVIESIALGVPVVATSVAVGGLPENLRKLVFIADHPSEFADKVSYILENPSIRTELIEISKTTIHELLSWDKIVSDFEQELKAQLILRSV